MLSCKSCMIGGKKLNIKNYQLLFVSLNFGAKANLQVPKLAHEY